MHQGQGLELEIGLAGVEAAHDVDLRPLLQDAISALLGTDVGRVDIAGADDEAGDEALGQRPIEPEVLGAKHALDHARDESGFQRCAERAVDGGEAVGFGQRGSLRVRSDLLPGGVMRSRLRPARGASSAILLIWPG